MPVIENNLKIGSLEAGGFRGINYSASDNKLAANQSPKCYNYLIGEKGLTSRKGCQKTSNYEFGGDGPVLGVVRFFDGSNYRTIGKRGTAIYEMFPTAAGETLLSGLSANEIFFEKWLGNYFFIDNNHLYTGSQNSVAPAKVTLCDSNGVALIGEKPQGSIPILHNGRLWWIGGNSTPFFSEVDFWDRYLTMDDPAYLACSLACDEDDGHKITAGLSYNGKLVVWKPNKMFFILGDYDELTNSIPQVEFYISTGVYNQKGVIKCGDGFIRGYGPDGIFQYTDSTGLQFIHTQINDELNKITAANREKVCVAWNDGLFLVFYAIDGIFNNRCLVYDPGTQDWFPFAGWNVACVTKFEDDWLYAGWSNSGDVKKLLTGNTDDTAPIESYYETKYFDLEAEYYVDQIYTSIVNLDSEVRVSWVSENTNTFSVIKGTFITEGARLADALYLSEGGFMLADQTNLQGSILIDEAILYKSMREFKARMAPGKRVRKIKFIFEAKGSTESQIDYLKARLVLAREV